MRFGLERMTALLGALGDPAAGRPGPARGGHQRQVVHRPPRRGRARRARARGWGRTCRPTSPTGPSAIQLDGEPVDEAGLRRGPSSAVRDAAEGLALPEGDDGDPVRGPHGGGLLGVPRRPGSDACVVEAGLGGRYDATNVLQPGAAVALTNIALEHTEFLGDTEEAIAAEKLAVVRRRLATAWWWGRLTRPRRARGGGRVRPPRPAPAALRRGTDGPRDVGGGGGDDAARRLPGAAAALAGRFQRDNLAVALAGAEMLRGRAPRPGGPGGGRGRGAHARAGWSWSPVPPIVLDGAHNPAGDGGHGRVAPGGARGPPPGGGGGLGARRQGRRRDGRRPSRRWWTGSSPPARATRARRPRRTSRRCARRPRDPRARGRGPRRRPSRRPAPETGPEGVVLVAGSLYLLADLRRYGSWREGARPPC